MAVGTPATEQGSRLEVVRVPMFSDNYGWIVRDPESGKVAAVDPAQPDVIQKALEERCDDGVLLLGLSPPGWSAHSRQRVPGQDAHRSCDLARACVSQRLSCLS